MLCSAVVLDAGVDLATVVVLLDEAGDVDAVVGAAKLAVATELARTTATK